MRSYLSFFSACARSNKGHVLFPLKVKLTKRTRCTFDIKKEIADFSSTVVASCLGIRDTNSHPKTLSLATWLLYEGDSYILNSGLFV